LPANVVIVPFGSIFRIRRLAESATNVEPSGAVAMPSGVSSAAAVAGAPSPPKPGAF